MRLEDVARLEMVADLTKSGSQQFNRHGFTVVTVSATVVLQFPLFIARRTPSFSCGLIRKVGHQDLSLAASVGAQP